MNCFLVYSGFELTERWYRLLFLDASIHPCDWSDDWARRSMTELTFRTGPDFGSEPADLDDRGGPEPEALTGSVLPHHLRIFREEEPDIEVLPISLEGLTGRRLAEKKLTLARAYLGYLPEFFPEISVPLRIELPELCTFCIQNAMLVEHRRRRPSTRVGVGTRIAPGLAVWASTPVGPDPEPLSEIDRGDVVITNQRIVFVGERQTREWRLDKLVSINSVPTMENRAFRKHQEHVGSSICFGVSNRQKVSGFAVNIELVPTAEFMVELALADHHDEREQLVLRLARELENHDR